MAIKHDPVSAPTLITRTDYNDDAHVIDDSTITESKLSLSDVTTKNASVSAHGFLKKLDNSGSHYMDGQGNWTTPSANSGVFHNVEDYGAVGDGATDDSTAINSAYTAAVSSGNAVYFPAGQYLCDSSITVPAGTTTYGAGPHDAWLNGMVYFSSNSRFQNIKIGRYPYGSDYTHGGPAVQNVSGANNVRFFDCHFAGGCNTGGDGGSSGVIRLYESCWDVHFESCRILTAANAKNGDYTLTQSGTNYLGTTSGSDTVLDVVSTTGVTVGDYLIDVLTRADTGEVVRVDQVVDSNTLNVVRAQWSRAAQAHSAGGVWRVYNGNAVRGSIDNDSDTRDKRAIVWRNCYFEESGRMCIEIFQTQNVDVTAGEWTAFKFENNYFDYCRGDAISLSCWYHGAGEGYEMYSGWTIINGNFFRGTTLPVGATKAFGGGIELRDVKRVLVNGNIFQCHHAYGVDFSNDDPSDAVMTQCMVTDNIFDFTKGETNSIAQFNQSIIRGDLMGAIVSNNLLVTPNTSSSGIYVSSAENSVISGNHIHVTKSSYAYGIRLNGPNNIVTGNYIYSTANSNGNPIYLDTGATGTILRDNIIDHPSGASADIYVASGASVIGSVRALGRTYAPITLDPDGSPWTWTNTYPYPVGVTVQGGTVSAIAICTDADPDDFITTGATTGFFPLRIGDQIKVTYSVEPTVRALPQP